MGGKSSKRGRKSRVPRASSKKSERKRTIVTSWGVHDEET